jgi:hypothetical protein
MDATLIGQEQLGAERLYVSTRNSLSSTKETNLNEEQEKHRNA